jgi:uncharacterized protein (DUF1330 family)
MTAYILVRVDVHDWNRYGEYIKHTPRVIAKFGGRFLIRSGDSATLEGLPETARIVLIEFPSLGEAKAFYDSTEYQVVKTLRDGAGSGTFTAFDGLGPEAWEAARLASEALPPPPG